jgi:hypothetical protein
MSAESLTDKQEAFCHRMAANLDGNGSECARDAGYTGNVAVTASKLLALPKVQRRIAELREMAVVAAQSPATALTSPSSAPLTGEVSSGPMMSPESRAPIVEGAAADVIRELQWIAHSDLTALFEYCRGDLLTVTDLKALPPEVRRVIKSIKVKTRTWTEDEDEGPITETSYELTLWPKDVALRTLAQFHGLLIERKITATMTVEEAIKAARAARAAGGHAR